MLSLRGYQFYLYTGIVNMRLGFNGLSGLVCNEMQKDPYLIDTIYVFINHRRNQVKLLLWDKDGYALYYKRLSKGTFGVPLYNDQTKSVSLSMADLNMMFDGIEIKYRQRYQLERRNERNPHDVNK
jgi:transposase